MRIKCVMEKAAKPNKQKTQYNVTLDGRSNRFERFNL